MKQAMLLIAGLVLGLAPWSAPAMAGVSDFITIRGYVTSVQSDGFFIYTKYGEEFIAPKGWNTGRSIRVGEYVVVKGKYKDLRITRQISSLPKGR